MTQVKRSATVSPVELKINGIPLVEALGKASRIVQVLAFLNSREDNEIFDIPTLAGEIGISQENMRVLYSKHKSRLIDHSCFAGRTRYFGNPVAIQALISQIQEGLPQ